MKDICGIEYNESLSDSKQVCFRPHFLSTLTHAKAWFGAPEGRICSSFVRNGDTLTLTLEVPAGVEACCRLSDGWVDALGRSQFPAASGVYQLKKA